jgi:hypothetical protein
MTTTAMMIALVVLQDLCFASTDANDMLPPGALNARRDCDVSFDRNCCYCYLPFGFRCCQQAIEALKFRLLSIQFTSERLKVIGRWSRGPASAALNHADL